MTELDTTTRSSVYESSQFIRQSCKTRGGAHRPLLVIREFAFGGFYALAANPGHRGDPALDTADWREDGGPGNLRADYVLPSADFRILDAGVFWPAPEDPKAGLLGSERDGATRHRLVWVDLVLQRDP